MFSGHVHAYERSKPVKNVQHFVVGHAGNNEAGPPPEKILKHRPWIWVFPKIGVPQNRWFIMENPIKMDDLGGKSTIFGSIHILINPGCLGSWKIKVEVEISLLKKCQSCHPGGDAWHPGVFLG